MRYFLIGLLPLTCPAFLEADQGKKTETVETLLARSKTVLAQLDGKISLPGLREPVEVLRDRWGIPHIYAKNAPDLFFAQGFIAAQDRLFQLDLWRRIATGETAEVFGKDALDGDRFARLVKYRGDMAAEWQSYSADTKEIATAFTAGINACIEHLGDRLPIEFQIAGFAPKKWQPEDVLDRMSGIVMTRNMQQEIYRTELIAAVGLEKARLLMPTDPPTDFAPAPELDLKGIGMDILSGYQAATKNLTFKPSPTESNNWVVSGARSASGKPMLANDPHRAISLPSLRYLVHLNAPGWNVIGSGEPALPGVAVGHNERMAWGFTIVGTDQADIFVEELNPNNASEYKVGDRWEKITVVREKAKVKGQPDPVELELRFTRNGPILHEDRKSNRAFVLKWVGSEPGTAGYLGCLALDRAGNWKEFLQALKAWKLPTENIIYADVDGNNGWVATALTPVRKNHNGLLPVPANGRYEWQGFLDVADLPQECNPARGYIATANHNILPPGYKHPLAFEWAPSYRVSRIKQRLEAKDKLTLNDFQSIQHDVISIPGQALARLSKIDMKDPQLEKYGRILRTWDGDLSVSSRAGPLYAAWLKELTQDFYQPHLPKRLLPLIPNIANLPAMLDALENPTATWFGPDPAAGRDQLLRTTFARAVAAVRQKLGDDPAGWSWGKMHTVTFHHPLATLGPAYAQAFNRGPLPRSGDGNTPNNTRYNNQYEQIHGASYRHLFDLADWDKGLATSTPGQSGQPGSPHYDDLLPLWAEGKYFPLAYSRQRVEEVTVHRLQLTPTKK